MNELRRFFDAEKSRIFRPDVLFARRVVAGLESRSSWRSGIWEMLPLSIRPVLALALIVIVCFVAIEMFVPQEPSRGVVESVLESEQSPAESFIYNDSDVPARQVVLQQLIGTEEQQ